MALIHRYFILAVFGICLLAGIQIPNFVDQYEKRIDAHFIEVERNFRGFQEIADRLFGGNVEALIEKHRQSEDKTFQAETEPIARMYARLQRFKQEKATLNTGFFGKILHILVRGDREILRETQAEYSPGLLLDERAIASGAVASGLVCLLLELLLGLAKRAIGRLRGD